MLQTSDQSSDHPCLKKHLRSLEDRCASGRKQVETISFHLPLVMMRTLTPDHFSLAPAPFFLQDRLAIKVSRMGR